MAESLTLQPPDPAPASDRNRFYSRIGFLAIVTLVVTAIEQFHVALFTALRFSASECQRWFTGGPVLGSACILILATAASLIVRRSGRDALDWMIRASVKIGFVCWVIIRLVLFTAAFAIMSAAVFYILSEPSARQTFITNGYELTAVLSTAVFAVLLGVFHHSHLMHLFGPPMLVFEIFLGCREHLGRPDTTQGYATLVIVTFLATYHLVLSFREHRLLMAILAAYPELKHFKPGRRS